MRFSGLVLFLLAPPVHAASDPLQVGAYQASVEQEQLRSQTKRLMADMNRMLEEFRGNPAAGEEVALTEATIKKLETLSETEMASVVLALREASSSKSGNAEDKVLSANKTAKDIQSTLVRLADKLALFQDEASVDLRLTGLIRRQIANQRQTKYLFDGSSEAGNVAREGELAAAEQKAIKEELDSLLQNLQKLASNPSSNGQSLFGAVFVAATKSGLAEASDSALGSAASKDYPAAAASQGKVIGALQDMLLALNSGKPIEERLRTAESQMRTLAAKEELLARTTTKTSVEEQRTLARRQNEIADQRTVVEREVGQLNAGASPILDQARQAMENLDSKLRKNRGLIDQPGNKLEVVNAQNGVAGNFRQIAEMLKKKADEIASANNSGGGDSNGSNDAMSQAADSLLSAINNMDLAQDQLNRGGDTGAAKEQIDKAAGDLAQAKKELGDSGDSSPESKDAGSALDQSKENLGKGGDEAANASGPSDRAKANQDVGRAKELAIHALGKLQQAIAANSTGMLAGSQANGQSQPSTGAGSGGGWGSIIKHRNESSAYSALAHISEQDREALSMVQQEKAPPEYSAMAEQYLKNLAEGAVPAR